MQTPRNFFRFRFAACVWLITWSSAWAHGREIEGAQKAASDWIRVRAETLRLESEWMSQRPLLESSVSALSQRAETLAAKRDLLSASQAEEVAELAEMEQRNRDRRVAFERAETQLQTLAKRLVNLRPNLPPRLSRALDKLYLSLADPEVTLADRSRFTLALLNRSIEFNRTISCEPELLHIESQAAPRLHDVIYWGLSHGYALDRQRQKAWYGSPGPRGWQWEELPDAAERVAALIAIYQGKQDPAFVAVPARLENSQPAQATDRH